MAASCTAASVSSGAGMNKRYDVIIVGSGAGGGTLASQLAPSGKSILILERGDWLKREAENLGCGGGVRGEPLRLAGHLVRPARPAVSAAGALFRRRGDQDLRRRALSPAAGGFRRVTASRRHLPGLADHLRGTRAVLYEGRADVSRPRTEGPGSD